MSTLKPGLRHTETMRVDSRHTVPHVDDSWPGFRDMPEILATAMMIGFIEQTCIEALRPYLADGQQTVGTKVDITHSAASLVGAEISADVELIEVDGRRLVFSVSAHDPHGSIGAGRHERFIIESDKFMARLAEKSTSI